MSSSPTYTVVDQFDEDEFPDIPKAPAALLAALNTVPDPRKPRGVRHALPGIVAIAEWAAAATPAGLAKFGVTGEVPSESTFRRTINKLDGNGLDFILGAWAALREVNPKELRVIAVDGKSVRGSATGGGRCRHLLAASTHISGMVLGQLDVALKTNEIPMFSTLLDNIELFGVLVTADALHCQKTTRNTSSNNAARITCSPSRAISPPCANNSPDCPGPTSPSPTPNTTAATGGSRNAP